MSVSEIRHTQKEKEKFCMKAVQFARYGGPEVLQLQEVPDPVPGPEDVLVAVKATTVNRLDLFQRDGSRPVASLPFTPGLEAVGVVAQDAHGFRVGERVMTARAPAAKGGGGYASMIAVPASDLARIPDGVTFEQAAGAGLAASTAWASLFDLGHLQAGERVLIWAGSSGVGSFAIQFARHAGAWVATTASSEERAETLRRLGANLVINRRQQDVAQVLQSEGGVNLVIELVSINACAPEGRIFLIGNLGGQQTSVDTQVWRLKRVHVIGGGTGVRTSPANEERLLRLIADGTVTPLVARAMPIEQAADAHRLLASGTAQGKIVLTHS
jgi:NADPH:quinone reductase-like Zn-dependent oxidoreductase